MTTTNPARKRTTEMSMTTKTVPTIRQGDVALIPVSKLPAGCTEVPTDGNRIVLAYGEVTGHAHAIYDHISPAAADEIVEAAIARAKARLWQSPSGDRYLEVTEPVTLRHEEHTAHTIPAGVYELPVQVSWDTEHGVRQVAD